MPTALQSAFLLHHRAYRETSVIADFLTEHDGRVSVVCKGVRGSGNKAASLRSILQPFASLAISWSGRSELKSLRSAEIGEPAPPLAQYQLYAALYLNELLMRLFRHGETPASLFADYKDAIVELSQSAADAGLTEVALRKFEFRLLATLGFEINFFHDASSAESIQPDDQYSFYAEIGFSRAAPDQVQQLLASDTLAIGHSATGKRLDGMAGKDILALQQQDYSAASTRKAAKKISRTALSMHLGDKPLKSRELYANPD